jgi:hypothetical protein
MHQAQDPEALFSIGCFFVGRLGSSFGASWFVEKSRDRPERKRHRPNIRPSG